MQKISYQAYQILVSLIRGQKYACKASLVANLAAQKNNCNFCHGNMSSSIQGNSAPFCRMEHGVILGACSLRKGIALECRRVERKNLKLLSARKQGSMYAMVTSNVQTPY